MVINQLRQIVLGELSLDHLARSDADAKWVKMMSDSLLSYRQLQVRCARIPHMPNNKTLMPYPPQAANESVISSAQKAYNLREEAIKAVEQMRKDKIDHEDEIYLKVSGNCTLRTSLTPPFFQFKEVLNSKKRKIALLMQEVETLRRLLG